MPGVPSSKACLACSKQKKKCDQATPACTRCTRLQIQCIGAGQQRYKFVEVTRPTTSREVTTLDLSSALSSNPVLIEFTHNLNINDMRYDLTWAYGPLLRDLPRRIGTNPALDAATYALCGTMSGLRLYGENKNAALERYGYALRMLRSCLLDPKLAYSPETLCAVYLVWICQIWLEDMENTLGHGSGMTRLLHAAPYRKNPNEFEKQLLITIAAPMAFESLFNSGVTLSPWLAKLCIDFEQEAIEASADPRMQETRGTGFLTVAVRLPELMVYNPAKKREVEETYESMHKLGVVMDEKMYQAVQHMEEAERSGSSAALHTRLHALWHRLLAFCLTLEIVLVSILHVYDPDDVVLEQKQSIMTRRLIELCLAGAVWKPLGAGWIPVALGGARCATTDSALHLEIDEALRECWVYGSTKSGGLTDSGLNSAFNRLRRDACIFRQTAIVEYVD